MIAEQQQQLAQASMMEQAEGERSYADVRTPSPRAPFAISSRGHKVHERLYQTFAYGGTDASSFAMPMSPPPTAPHYSTQHSSTAAVGGWRERLKFPLGSGAP